MIGGRVEDTGNPSDFDVELGRKRSLAGTNVAVRPPIPNFLLAGVESAIRSGFARGC